MSTDNLKFSTDIKFFLKTIPYNIIEVPVAKIPVIQSDTEKIIFCTGPIKKNNATLEPEDDSPLFVISNGTIRVYSKDHDTRKRMVDYLSGIYIPSNKHQNLFEQFLYASYIYGEELAIATFKKLFENMPSKIPTDCYKLTEAVALLKANHKSEEYNQLTITQQIDNLVKLLFPDLESQEAATSILQGLVLSRVV